MKFTKLMNVKELRNIIMGKNSNTMVYVQIENRTYPILTDETVDGGSYIRLVVDSTQWRNER